MINLAYHFLIFAAQRNTKSFNLSSQNVLNSDGGFLRSHGGSALFPKRLLDTSPFCTLLPPTGKPSVSESEQDVFSVLVEKNSQVHLTFGLSLSNRSSSLSPQYFNTDMCHQAYLEAAEKSHVQPAREVMQSAEICSYFTVAPTSSSTESDTQDYIQLVDETPCFGYVRLDLIHTQTSLNKETENNLPIIGEISTKIRDMLCQMEAFRCPNPLDDDAVQTWEKYIDAFWAQCLDELKKQNTMRILLFFAFMVVILATCWYQQDPSSLNQICRSCERCVSVLIYGDDAISPNLRARLANTAQSNHSPSYQSVNTND